MKVQVEEKIFIESDDRQFILKEYTGKFDKEDKEIYKTLGYFSSVAQALKHLVKLKIMQSTAASIKELIEDVERIEKRIDSLIRT